MSGIVALVTDSTESFDIEQQECDLDSLVSATDSHIPLKRKRVIRSWIWKWGVEEGKFWRCTLCVGTQKLLTFSATTHIITHLKKVHRKSENPLDLPSSNDQLTLYAPRQLNHDIVLRLLINWIVRTQQPFTVIESEPFRQLLTYLNSNTLKYIPKTADTIRTHTQSVFHHTKRILIENLSTARSDIHFSFDLWSSPNYKAMIAVVGHWTAKDYSLKTVLLGIREVHGSHTGPNITNSIYPLLEELGVLRKLGYSISDNAGNNDTALESLSDIMLEKHGIYYNTASHRLRCLGHIINLVVKTLLFGSNFSSIDDHAVTNVESIRSFYMGAIGKLHHIVHHIRMTPQRRDLYYSEQASSLQASPEFMVVADNATRWNSTYHMIKAALILRQRIDGYVRLVGKELSAYSLLDDEWNDLSELAIMLAPFDKVSRVTQGNDQGQGSIVSVILSMDMLLSRLETIKFKATTTSSTFFSTVDAAWTKLNKYYTLTDRSPIHVVSIILHPCMKMKYFIRHWSEHPAWIDDARRQMDQYYTEYSGTVPTESVLETLTQSEMDDWCFGSSRRTETELDEYLTAPVITLRGEETIESFNIVHWWQGNEGSFPTLAHIAYNVFAVPAMSAEAERVFSRYPPMLRCANNYSQANDNGP